MRPSATTALLESVSTSPKRRTGQTTIVTKDMKMNNSPTLIEPAARNMPPAIKTMPICAMERLLLMAQ